MTPKERQRLPTWTLQLPKRRDTGEVDPARQPSTLHLRRERRPHRWTSAISPDEGMQRIILTFIEDSTNGDPKDA